MNYLLWPFLRATAVMLLVVLTVSGFLRAALRALTGANQIPPSQAGCWMQFITLPLFAPIVFIYYLAQTLYLWVIFFDVKLGFTSLEKGFDLAFRFYPDPSVDREVAYDGFRRRIRGLEAGETPSAGEAEVPEPEPKVSKAEILEEMCQLEGMLAKHLRGGSRLTHAESNILGRKIVMKRLSLFGGGTLFPVSDTASEEEIDQWLNHPLLNIPLPDPVVMNMAANSPVPTATMERILRKLLQEDYDMHWRMAEARVRSKKLSQ
jgi:hypothetical protein